MKILSYKSTVSVTGSPCWPARQAGVATLVITVILLAVSTLSALVVSRSAFFEQKITGNDIRNREVYAAAMAGQEYGINWMRSNIEVWDVATAGGVGAPPILANLKQNVDTYTFADAGGKSTITFELLTAAEPADSAPAVIKIVSKATAVTDNQVTKTVTAYVLQSSILTLTIAEGPPLVVENCIPLGAQIVGGTPDIYPKAPDYLAMATIGGTPNCLNEGNFKAYDTSGTVIPVTKGDLSLAGDVDATDPLWNTIFGGLSREAFKSLAAAYPKKFIFVDSNYKTDGYYSAGFTGATWGTNVGTAADQVILVFDSSANCPKINGGTVIYGLVYYDTKGCTSNGWGGGDIYGTVAMSGDLSKFNANAKLRAMDLSSFNGGNEEYMFVTMIPGSWRDF